jgi:Flp pilus assembly protein TadG
MALTTKRLPNGPLVSQLAFIWKAGAMRFQFNEFLDRSLLAARCAEILCRFRRDENGSFVVITALLLPVLIGMGGLATEVGVWFYQHEKMQNAADAGAMSAALASSSNNTTTEARAVIQSFGYVNGYDNATVAVNQPPSLGSHSNNASAIEIVIQRTQRRFFSGLFNATPMVITARSVALNDDNGDGCVLTLDKTASAAGLVQGTANVVLIGCSIIDNSKDAAALTAGGSAWVDAKSVRVTGGISGQNSFHTTDGIRTGVAPADDPYASVSNPTPSGPTVGNCCNKNTPNLSPGVYTNGMKLVGGASITLSPGTYFIQGSGLDVAGGASLTGNGVTLVFMSGATATINGNSNVSLTAPTAGNLAGIAVFGDRNMPMGTSFKFNGGATQSITGAIYLPNGAANFAGGMNASNACMQLIADTVTFTGNSYFAINCSGKGTKPIVVKAASLLE